MTGKTIISLILLIFIYLLISSQVFSQKVLDKAEYKFHYEYSRQFDTLSNNDIRDDLIILQIGPDVSKSYSYYSFQGDSLMSTKDGKRVRDEAFTKSFQESMIKGEPPKHLPYGRRMSTIVYKNYPQGKMTVTDAINANYYQYSDELHAQTWQITDSTKTILEYTCQMAVSDFRGRRWVAWFAHDIPISDGPWKFSGLPGLIMEVYDSEKHFSFTLVGIEEVQDERIVFSPVVIDCQSFGKYEETTRLDFLKGLARYLGMNAVIMNAELGRETFDESGSNVKHNDLMERDYR